MTVKRLREALEEVTAILETVGAKSQSKSFKALLDIFDGHDGKSTASFLAELQQGLAQPKSSASKAGAGADKGKVDEYVRRLSEAGIDEVQFNVVFKDLQKDRAVRKGEADLIANMYTRGRSRWPKKGDAIDAVRRTFEERLYQAAKMVQVDKASLDFHGPELA